MERIILIRHGQTDTNVKGVLHSTKEDEFLNDEGVRQMKEVAKKLKSLSPAKVYTSNEKRTIQSGEVIAEEFGVKVDITEGIGERNWGDFAGRKWEEIQKVLDPMTLNERYEYLPPNGESWKQFETRLIKAINNILLQNKEKTVAVISHGGVIRALMPYLLGLPKEESFKYDPNNASIIIFDHNNGKFSPVIISDITHLK
jgi:broad specificity phosphatase PhoE